MHAFTLRLEPALAKKLAEFCKKKGYSKTGLVKSLVRDFIERETASVPDKKTVPPDGEKRGLASLVGIVSFGGDSVKDCNELFY